MKDTELNPKSCSACGVQSTANAWCECWYCDGTGRADIPTGLPWCEECFGKGGEWMCLDCLNVMLEDENQ